MTIHYSSPSTTNNDTTAQEVISYQQSRPSSAPQIDNRFQASVNGGNVNVHFGTGSVQNAGAGWPKMESFAKSCALITLPVAMALGIWEYHQKGEKSLFGNAVKPDVTNITNRIATPKFNGATKDDVKKIGDRIDQIEAARKQEAAKDSAAVQLFMEQFAPAQDSTESTDEIEIIHVISNSSKAPTPSI